MKKNEEKTGTTIWRAKTKEYWLSKVNVSYHTGDADFDDFNKFKIIWDFNSVLPYVTSQRTRNTMPNNNDSISFLSDDKSVLLIRSFTDDGDRWRKLTLFPTGNKSFYTIKTTLDLFIKETIIPFTVTVESSAESIAAFTVAPSTSIDCSTVISIVCS